MWFLTCLFLPLMQWNISLIKKTFYEIALEIVCYVTRCSVVYGVSFERCSSPSWWAQAWVTPLGPPLISAQLWWTVIGSLTSPTSSRSTLCSSASELSPEPWKPLRSMGVNTPMYWRSIKGGKSQLTRVPVLRGTVLRLILLGSSARVAHTRNCFLSSFLHPLSHSTHPLTAASNQIIYLH